MIVLEVVAVVVGLVVIVMALLMEDVYVSLRIPRPRQHQFHLFIYHTEREREREREKDFHWYAQTKPLDSPPRILLGDDTLLSSHSRERATVNGALGSVWRAVNDRAPYTLQAMTPNSRTCSKCPHLSCFLFSLEAQKVSYWDGQRESTGRLSECRCQR